MMFMALCFSQRWNIIRCKIISDSSTTRLEIDVPLSLIRFRPQIDFSFRRAGLGASLKDRGEYSITFESVDLERA